MTARWAFVALWLLAALGVFSPSYAKTDDKLQQVEEELDKKIQEEDALEQAAEEASKGLENLQQRMIESTQTLQEKQAEQESLEGRLDDLTREIAEKSKNVEQEEHRLSLMLSVLVDIASRPPESLFMQDRALADHVHRSLLLQEILPRVKAEAERAARDLQALIDLKKQLAAHEKIVSTARRILEKRQKDLDKMIAVRQGSLKRTEKQKEEIAKHLEALASEAHDLRQLMKKVTPKRAAKPSVAEAPALKWPVSGAVRRNFGDKDADGVVSEGLTFSAPPGAPIVAPRAGKVVFAGPFRGYGLIMILQHDGGYYSFLSGFGRCDADLGQKVKAGEPLGVLPVKTKSKPELYFEWRNGDKPVDPKAGVG